MDSKYCGCSAQQSLGFGFWVYWCNGVVGGDGKVVFVVGDWMVIIDGNMMRSMCG